MDFRYFLTAVFRIFPKKCITVGGQQKNYYILWLARLPHTIDKDIFLDL